jgi:hypothetical protein
VSDAFASYCDRDTFANSAIVEYPEGKGDDTVYLRNYPVTETTSSVILWIDEGRLYADSEKITRSEYAVIPNIGKIVLDGGVFSTWPLANKVSYYGGYVTLPGDLEWAAKEACQFFWKRKQTGGVGVQSTSPAQGGSVSVESDLPAAVKTVLDRYRRWSP